MNMVEKSCVQSFLRSYNRSAMIVIIQILLKLIGTFLDIEHAVLSISLVKFSRFIMAGFHNLGTGLCMPSRRYLSLQHGEAGVVRESGGLEGSE